MIRLFNSTTHIKGGRATEGSDVTLNSNQKCTFKCRITPGGAGLALQTHYHSFPGEILPHFYVKNISVAQKLRKLEHFKENL